MVARAVLANSKAFECGITIDHAISELGQGCRARFVPNTFQFFSESRIVMAVWFWKLSFLEAVRAKGVLRFADTTIPKVVSRATIL